VSRAARAASGVRRPPAALVRDDLGQRGVLVRHDGPAAALLLEHRVHQQRVVQHRAELLRVAEQPAVAAVHDRRRDLLNDRREGARQHQPVAVAPHEDDRETRVDQRLRLTRQVRGECGDSRQQHRHRLAYGGRHEVTQDAR
jgi:hypothetical protein